MKNILQAAFELRQSIGLHQNTDVLRIFYGPGEGASTELRSIAVDWFCHRNKGKNEVHLWVTQWDRLKESTIQEIIAFYQTQAADLKSIVLIDRSQPSSAKGANNPDVQTLWGTPPSDRFSVIEAGIPFLVQFEKTKHPGLFLDHAPLRRWLQKSQKKRRVLNLFAYTGSLSVAAAKGGADHVTTVDLSKSTLDWARDNWIHAGLNPDQGEFIYGDTFDWLARFVKKGRLFDTVISDPPSFSRNQNQVFSTQKDLVRLHRLLFSVLAPKGLLITSINSENVPENRLIENIQEAAQQEGRTFLLLKKIDLPESFPTHGHRIEDRYLKGWILQS